MSSLASWLIARVCQSFSLTCWRKGCGIDSDLREGINMKTRASVSVKLVKMSANS